MKTAAVILKWNFSSADELKVSGINRKHIRLYAQ